MYTHAKGKGTNLVYERHKECVGNESRNIFRCGYLYPDTKVSYRREQFRKARERTFPTSYCKCPGTVKRFLGCLQR